MKLFVLVGLALVSSGIQTVVAKTSDNSLRHSAIRYEQPGGGGDKDKKKDGEKGGKKDEDESTKDAKTSDISSKPSKHARLSAKTAKQSMKFTQQQMMARAKVRLFFHNMFNTKYGKPVNFRSTRQRNRWKHGH